MDDAVEKLVVAILKDGASVLTTHGATVVSEIAIAEFRADLLGYFPPKDLEWRSMSDQFIKHVKNHWVCESTNHMYQIYDCGKYWRVQMGALVIKFDSCLTLEAAKAAAQADYIKRIEELF